MNNWLHQQKQIKELSDFDDNIIGFVYKITNKQTGKFYIGKKILRNTLNKIMTKKAISEWDKPGRIPKKRKEIKESNWKDYYGSSKPLVEDVKKFGVKNFTREILKPCTHKKEMGYWETYYQFKLEVLHTENSYNENIAGKYYRRDVYPVILELLG